MVTPFLPDAEKVRAVREALPATGAGIYLNAGTAGPLPAEVAAAMDEVAGWELRTGRASTALFPETLQRLDEARASVAAVLRTDIDAIALTRSTSDGLGTVVAGIDWRPGDRVVTSSLEHIGLLGSLYAARDRRGIEIAYVDAGTGADEDALVEGFARAIDTRTRLVALSHVAWTTGAVLPVARIAALARERGALVLVDGAQAAGAIPVDPDALGADAYALPGQKWLLGPEGMGALWVRPSAVERIGRTTAGFLSFERSDTAGLGAPWPGARRFETGAFHRPSVVGFARSLGWLAMFVGLEWAFERAGRGARSLADALAPIPGVRLVTPRDRMGTIVSFAVDGWRAEQVVAELGSRIFAIVRPVPGELVRTSVGFWTTDEELERFVAGVAEIAAHTPETLPRKPRLTILGEDA